MNIKERINDEMNIIYLPNEKKCVIWGALSMSIAMVYWPVNLISNVDILKDNVLVCQIIRFAPLCISVSFFFGCIALFLKEKKINIGNVFSVLAMFILIYLTLFYQ